MIVHLRTSTFGANFMHEKKFPIDCVPYILREAILCIQLKTRAPIELVATSVFSGASLATQSGHDVERPNNLVSPVGLYFLAIAKSGERKTTIDNMTFEPFLKFSEANSSNEMSENHRRFIYSDVTPFAFISGLFKNSCSAALIEDEASRIFNGKLIEDIGLLNKIWNGTQLFVDRKKESFTVESPRCTISWMVQPKAFRSALKKRGEQLHDSGFFARCIVCEPRSTLGTRLMNRTKKTNMLGYERYSDRVKELLESQVEYFCPGSEKMEHARKLISLDQAAQQHWIDVFDHIELNLGVGGTYQEYPQYGSKMAENIARLAAIFHIFEGYPGSLISHETIYAATEVIYWYADEFLRVFREPDFEDQIIEDAIKLEKFMSDYSKRTGFIWINKTVLQQLGPNSLRKAARLDPILEYLGIKNKIFINRSQNLSGRGKLTHTTIISLTASVPTQACQLPFVNQALFNGPSTFLTNNQ